MRWRELLGLTRNGERDSGRPPSGNGASSFHLFWELPPHEPLHEVSATFELLDEPARDELYLHIVGTRNPREARESIWRVEAQLLNFLPAPTGPAAGPKEVTP